MKLASLAALLMLAAIPFSGRVLADDEPPGGTPSPAAEQRYQEGRDLMQRGRYLDAAEVFHRVAESADASPLLQAQALFAEGLMQENARAYERAIAIYAEVEQRYPGSVPADRAKDATRMLTEGGPNVWLDFRRRLDAVWDDLTPGQELVEREGLGPARPRLLRAATQLEELLRAHPDHPRAKDVMLTLGNTHMLLREFDLARTDFQRAIEMGRRQTEAGDRLSPETFSFVRNAEERLGEAIREFRREWFTRIAWVLIAVVGVAALPLRPWRGGDAILLRIGASLAAATLVMAAAAMGIAYYLRNYSGEISPVQSAAAGLLVVLPGLTGDIVTLAYVAGLRRTLRWTGWKPAGIAAALGAIAAFAVATCVINAYALFQVLDSEL